MLRLAVDKYSWLVLGLVQAVAAGFCAARSSYSSSDGSFIRARFAYPERFAQQALGHNSKAVHHAYSKHADVTLPSLDDWEKNWQESPQRNAQPKLRLVDFRLSLVPFLQKN